MTNPLPEQVARGLAEAEAIDAAMAAPAPDPADPPPGDPPAPAPELVAAAPTPAPAPEPWEARYRTLQGMYDADVKSVRADNQRLTGELADLQRKLDAAPKTEAPKLSPVVDLPGVTQKDRDAFGDDLIEVIERSARKLAAEQTAPLLATIAELQAKTGTVETKVTTVEAAQQGDASTRLMAKLTELVPDWQTVNASPEFLQWCAKENPLTGEPNQVLLDRASAAGNPERIAKVFAAYKTEAGIAAAPAAPAVTPEAKAELETQLAPGQSKAIPPATTEGERSFSLAEIDDFYRRVSKGEFKGREAEAQALEAQIDRATIAGRVK